jgi:hypothetical protein
MQGMARTARLTVAPERLDGLRALGPDPASTRYALVTRGPRDPVSGSCLQLNAAALHNAVYPSLESLCPRDGPYAGSWRVTRRANR